MLSKTAKKRRKKQKPRSAARIVLFNTQFKRCHWCDCECIIDIPKEGERHPDNLFTVDHVVELSKDGIDDWSNWVGACYRCNIDRSK